MKKIFLLLLCAYAPFLTACNEDVLIVPEQRTNVRIINVAGGTPALRIVQEHSGFDKTVSFGSRTPYTSVLSGRSLMFELFNPASPVRYTFLQYIFAQNAHYTIMISGNVPQPFALPLIDTLTSAGDSARIRAVQLSEISPDISFYVAVGNDTLPFRYYGRATELGYGDWTLYTGFPSGVRSLLAKDPYEDKVVGILPGLQLKAGSTYTVFSYDSAGTTQIQILEDIP